MFSFYHIGILQHVFMVMGMLRWGEKRDSTTQEEEENCWGKVPGERQEGKGCRS